MEGIASIALLPSGSLSGHFISFPDSVCYALYGTGIFPSLCSFFTFKSCILGYVCESGERYKKVGKLYFGIELLLIYIYIAMMVV